MTMTVFVFKVICSKCDIEDAVCETIHEIGGKYDRKRNVGKWKDEKYPALLSCKAQFYFAETKGICNIRVTMNKCESDSRSLWHTFLEKLLILYPKTDFGINVSEPRYILAVLDLTGNTQEVVTTRTSGGTSLGGFFLGGALFGAPGAIVGGLSGTQHTTGISKMIFSDRISVRILWNDGCITEENLTKKSRLYQEVMTMLA